MNENLQWIYAWNESLEDMALVFWSFDFNYERPDI